MRNRPDPNNRVSGWNPWGNAVLKITFAELLRSCSCNISARMLWRVRNSRSALRLGVVGLCITRLLGVASHLKAGQKLGVRGRER